MSGATNERHQLRLYSLPPTISSPTQDATPSWYHVGVRSWPDSDDELMIDQQWNISWAMAEWRARSSRPMVSGPTTVAHPSTPGLMGSGDVPNRAARPTNSSPASVSVGTVTDSPPGGGVGEKATAASSSGPPRRDRSVSLAVRAHPRTWTWAGVSSDRRRGNASGASWCSAGVARSSKASSCSALRSSRTA